MEQENQHFNGVGWRVFHLILGPLMFGLVYGCFDPPGLSPDGVAVLAVTLWVAVWWITEAIPIAATSLLPIVLFPVTGALGMEETTSAYAHKYIFLYIGGFILAIATERWNLHKRIALNIIYLIGTRAKLILLGFMLATAVLSMWISNTASAVMMLPIGLAIVAQISDEEDGAEEMRSTFGRILMLSIAYSASIGGVATLIGTAPNLVLASMVEELYGIEISFAQWFVVGFPISMCILFVAWWYLARHFDHFKRGVLSGGKEKIRGMLSGMGKMRYEEKAVATLFLVAAFAWMTRSYVLTRWIPGLDDAGIALIAALALFIIPASRRTGRALITWEEAVRLPWGILLLFGGGLSIAQGFKTSGLAEWLGGHLTLLQDVPTLILLLVLVAGVNFLTEITSNLATTAMILPVLASMALHIDVHPFVLMTGATIAASCAFMLPVATPPNAIVFGSGYLTIPGMMRVGIWMNIISILLITFLVYFVVPWVWGISLSPGPSELLPK